MRPKQDPKPHNPPKKYAEPVKPDQATGATNDWVRGYYVTGDGDVLQSRRAGSDHSHLKSKGF